MGISDDNDTRAMLKLYSIVNTIELHVKKDIISHLMYEGHGEFTHMLYLDNESTCFMSPVYIYISNREFYFGVYISLSIEYLDDINIWTILTI